ncbi:uncharacterized protein LOC117106823 isoform X2 [Anneissia japonica]|uniref:uncharacterized protein LOC117106823 isoform X2 n=1 Tax=Anneissia japonica TaxID=1529436 RepID=UPI0014258805|nr:uncharacterized protein LOC117106823 isoform X2 [Anneissia japonica]
MKTEAPAGATTKTNLVAKQIKEQHENSRCVFPTSKIMKGKKGFRESDRLKSLYDVDFAPKHCIPCTPRPCSVTRRNNPHPSQMFMTWKVPTRLIVSEPSYVQQKQKLINDSNQHFYEDINGARKSISPHHDVLDGISAFKQMQLSLDRPAMARSSTTHHSPPYHMFKHMREKEIEDEMKRSVSKSLPKLPVVPPNSAAKIHQSAHSNSMNRSLKPKAMPAAQKWIHSASEKDKAVLGRMMKDVDNHYMDKTLSKALQPDAKKAVEKWLETASEKDRSVAIEFFSSLAGSKLMGVKDGKTNEACNVCDGSRLKQVLEALNTGKRATISVPKDTTLGHFTRRQPRIRLLSPRTRANKEEHKTWHHLPVFAHKPPVSNTIGMFTRPHRPVARHFTIHPEWE